jgi:toxin secretion/phage lysis holin
MDQTFYKTLLAVTGSAVSFLFGGWPALMETLLIFIIIDYITGMLASGMEGKLSSTVGLKGIAKKIAILIMVVVAHFIDQLLESVNLFRDAAIFFYISNELLSIIENMGRIGLPVPTKIRKAVEILKSKKDKEE